MGKQYTYKHLKKKKKAVDPIKVWIDLGVNDQKEAMSLVSVGDYATFKLEPIQLAGTRIACPGIDDKVGVYVVMRALEILSRAKNLEVGVCAVASVQEEFGTRGAEVAAYGLNPMAAIAVDVTFATDHPGLDKNTRANIEMGKGPALTIGGNINPNIHAMLLAAAKTKKIKTQINPIAGATGTNARALQISRAGIPTSLVAPPIRHMHTPIEVVDMKDLENAAQLIAAFVKMVKIDTDFRPW